jgi:hypothetical protein
MLSKCKHRGFVYGLDYCPECGETDISKLLHERYIHELKARIALLEAQVVTAKQIINDDIGRIRELETFLVKLKKSGWWYRSELEFDTRNFDGKKLEAELNTLLGAVS